MGEINVKITKDEKEKLVELIGYLSSHVTNDYEKEYIKTLKSSILDNLTILI
mgnify:CR=1 FL=1